jgi:BCD family chlorophyll transporter-like MFS transporter
MTATEQQTGPQASFSVLRSLKVGTFHIGSSLTDVMLSGVWNRIMISDLGLAAWPVSLLLAARYFLAPLALWSGHRSDTRPLFGSQRTSYIWIGRLMMLLALPLLPISVVAIAQGAPPLVGWGLALISLLLYGTGTSISGAPYLALVHDSAPYGRRGQAVSITQFVLVVSFAFVGILYARIMPSYNPEQFRQLVFLGMLGAAFFWIVSILGEERRSAQPVQQPADLRPSLKVTLKEIWSEQPTRRYALFLGASAFFAFMQDAMLEPFGGDVFGLPAGDTTRFNAYWGAGVVVGMIGTYFLTRRRSPDQQVSTTAWGLATLATPILLLSYASLQETLVLVKPVLVFFGLGFGVFTVGGVSLLMAMSTARQAASYLALWSVIQLVTRGAGIAAGGILRDLALTISGQVTLAYGTVFVVEALGLFLCIALLLRVDIKGFAADHHSVETF